jgi:hypothetical protein
MPAANASKSSSRFDRLRVRQLAQLSHAGLDECELLGDEVGVGH